MKPTLKKQTILIGAIVLLFACRQKKTADIMQKGNRFSDLKEIQLTQGQKGHYLHQFQSFSPNDEWLVYDTRNDGTHIGITCCIEMINLNSKEIRLLYQTKNQTKNGPGVGAATFNPKKNQVLFISGLENCNSERPYGFSRRTGISIKINSPEVPIHLDARDVIPPFTPGALRGGTHAHSWSPDGNWVSFTYNDDIMAKLAEENESQVKDLRMVGVMAPLGAVSVEKEDEGENLDGKMFSIIISELHESPKLGSNQIDRAYGDAWIGNERCVKNNGKQQVRTLAFFGDTRDSDGNTVTEVFIIDLPEEINKGTSSRYIQGTNSSRPMPPVGVDQRRITHTQDRMFPGVQGPRHSLRSLPDGSLLLFMMKDDDNIVQIYGVSPKGGENIQITNNKNSVETTFDVSPDGKFVAYGINEDIYITNIKSGKTQINESNYTSNPDGLQSINWSNSGKYISYNRKVQEKDTSYFQIFILKMYYEN